jgi:hypothetical protein
MVKKQKHRRSTKRKPVKVHKVALAPKQVLSVTVPSGHTPLVVTAAERIVEVVPVPKKKRGWWESLLYGDTDLARPCVVHFLLRF